MNSFFVEFRLHGYAKTHARRVIWDVARKYRVRGMGRSPVPHFGLYPPSSTSDIRDVIRTVERVGQHYTLVPFSIKGFGCYRSTGVIYIDIEPSRELNQLRAELTYELNSALGKANQEYDFHTTIAFKDLGNKFDSIWNYVRTQQQPDIDQYLLRITVVGERRRIICEYDLVLKRVLNRQEALSRDWWKRTLDEMGRLQGRTDVWLPLPGETRWRPLPTETRGSRATAKQNVSRHSFIEKWVFNIKRALGLK
jgi:hypothetical protein